MYSERLWNNLERLLLRPCVFCTNFTLSLAFFSLNSPQHMQQLAQKDTLVHPHTEMEFSNSWHSMLPNSLRLVD